MEPVLCPNGHPNRPGTRICAVCWALIPAAGSQPPAADSRPQPAAGQRPPASDRRETADDKRRTAVTGKPPADSGRRSSAGCWLLALLALLFAAVVVMAVYILLFPARRGPDYLATAAVITLPGVVTATEVGLAAVSPSAPDLSSTVPPPASPTPPPTTGLPTPVATITPLGTIVGVVLTPTAALPAGQTLATGPNLIQNGDFGDDWVNGWERQAEGLNGTQVVELGTLALDPPLPSLRVAKSGAGALRVVQHVVLTGAASELAFRGRIRLAGTVAPSGDEGRAALILLYEDAGGQPLGASVWLDGSATASHLWGGPLPPFAPTTAPRIVEAGWQLVEISLAREFTDRLPDVDAAAVRRITLVLAVLGSDTCPPDACPAALDAADFSLSASAPGN